MWPKTLLGFMISLLLNTCLMLNLAYLTPLPRDVYLLLAFVGGILLWAGIMTVFYCTNKLQRTMLYCIFLLFVSAGINVMFYLGMIE